MTYLSDITRLSKPNMGGLTILQVARAADILSMTEPVNGVIYSAINFQAGTGFNIWYAADQTMSMVSDDRNTTEGKYKANQLPFFIAKDRPEIKAQLDKAEQDEFVVLYKDANGKIKLFGTKDKPVSFIYSYSTDETRAGRNGYSCRFYYDGPDNVNFYNAAIASAPVGIAPIIIQWNGATILSAQPGVVSVVNFISEFEYSDFEINPIAT